MYECIKACTGLALTVVVLHVTSADVFSSTYKLEQMVLGEENLLKELGNFADDQFQLLRNISMFSAIRKREVRQRNISKSLSDMKHPNFAYQFITWSALKYRDAFGMNSGIFEKSVEKSLGVILMNMSDFLAANSYLIRLQGIYNLSISDMINGNYLGFQGPKLIAIEVGQLGMAAFQEGLLHESMQFVNQSFEALTRNVQEEMPLYSFTRQRIKSMIGRLHYHLGDFNMAQSIHMEINMTDPMSYETELLGGLLDNGYPEAPTVSYSRDVFNNYSRLCRSDKEFNYNTAEVSQLTCRYRESPLPYYRFDEEVLSNTPFISVIYNFLSDVESEHVKTVMKHQLMKLPESINLTSELLIKYETAKEVARRIESVTWLKPLNNLPDGPLSNDEIFKATDEYEEEKPMNTSQSEFRDNKLATFMIYLSDAETGGSTAFYETNISVAAKKNMAVFWYNFDPAQVTSSLTKHAWCPVIYGDRWINAKWSLEEKDVF
ncbi:hypothetical protein Btru_025569 [Bulinus truncatus]|nr:hypothetical protein Btru_025569 [Bulinus truncatus]